MADRAVGDEALHVLLHEANERAINDADQGEHDDDLDDLVAQERISRKQWQRKANESVGAHFQQDAGEDDGTGRGSFGVRIGEPGVEREHGNLNGKREKESPEEPHLQRIGKVLRGREKRWNVERARPTGRNRRIEVKRQNREKHDDRSGEGVQEKLDGGVEATIAAPDADQEVHGNEHHFPENVKEEEIQGNENADHAGLQQEKKNVIFLGALVNRAPRREDGDHPEESGKHDEQKANAVDSEMIFRADRRNPIGGFLKGEAAPLWLEPADQRKRDQKTEYAKNVASDLMRLLAFAGNEQQKQSAHERSEQDDAQDVMCKKVHSLSPLNARCAAIPAHGARNTPEE